MAAFESVERGIYGIQFHPEVVHTPYGQQVLSNFLDRRLRLRAHVARGIGDRRAGRARSAPRSATAKVICGLSGGVDSTVAALLVHRAIGDRLTCVFVDHGLMRKNEGEQVIAAFRDHFQRAAGRRRRRRPLPGASSPGVTDPEHKRKMIGAEFIRVFEEEGGSKLARAACASSSRARCTPT